MTSLNLTTEQKIIQSYRNGTRGSIYTVSHKAKSNNKSAIKSHQKERMDSFISDSSYKGEWKDDLKHGFGTEIYRDGSKYSGEWCAGQRQGRGTFWIVKNKIAVHQYVGEWYDDKMDGYGVYYYENGDEYKGDWKQGKRCGEGRLDYKNGDYYLGEWSNDYQHGLGSYYHKNGNTYEGMWMNGRKEGKGRFFYGSTKKVYEGEWIDDQPKCGEFRDPDQSELYRFRSTTVREDSFTLPVLGLKDSNQVINMSLAELRNENHQRRGVSDAIFTHEQIVEALKEFEAIDRSRNGAILVYNADPVFEILGLELSKDTLREIIRQVDYEEQPLLSFADILDIAACLQSRE